MDAREEGKEKTGEGGDAETLIKREVEYYRGKCRHAIVQNPDWTDSRQTKMSFRQSRDTFDGERIVLYSKSVEPEGKDARRSKTITHLDANGNTLVHRQYAIGADGEERLMMELVMVRESAKP